MKRVNFRGFTEREVKLLEYALKLKCNQSNLSDEVFNEYYDLYMFIKEARKRVQGVKVEFPSKHITIQKNKLQSKGQESPLLFCFVLIICKVATFHITTITEQIFL
jgi:hypothetical protein